MSGAGQPASKWSLKLGIALFVISVLLPLVGIPIVAKLDFSKSFTAALSGGLFIGGEALGLVAIAVMGKAGYAFIKNNVLGFLKKHGPPDTVSRRRYTIGLVMFCTPMLFAWLSLYIAHWIPGFLDNPMPYALIGDVILITSIFMLGGDFWDKIRALFIHDARARF